MAITPGEARVKKEKLLQDLWTSVRTRFTMIADWNPLIPSSRISNGP